MEWIQQFSVYDFGRTFKVSHVHSNGWQSVDFASTALIFNTKNWGAMKERLTVTQVQNEEDRHRVKIQTHTQNKEKMLRRASQVTFVKKIYIKYYFIWETVVEWVYCWNACKSDVTASLIATLLFSFSLICKADAVKKRVFFYQLGLVKAVYPRWMSSYLLVCLKTKETNKHSTLLLPKYPSLAKPVTLPSAS